MSISLIACINKNRGLGLNNRLLYKIPEDMKFFRETTKGHTVIMGKKTFLSIGRPLPKRTNIVITRDKNFKAEGCIAVYTVEDALSAAQKQFTSLTAVNDVNKNNGEIFVIGGAQIYEQTINKADKLYLTIVDDERGADAFFPKYDEFKKTTLLSEGEYQGLKYKILEFTK